MIYCSNCGKTIPDESKFCTFCGTAIAVVDPQKPVAETHAHEPLQTAAPNTASGTKNAFYTNAGFWGALLLKRAVRSPNAV